MRTVPPAPQRAEPAMSTSTSSTSTSPKPSSQLAALEQAFAAAPTSGAWRALAEAYLAAGRHLEATVVAKKAVRSRPEDPAPRVFVARVLAAQGKTEKARAEVEAVRSAHPGDEAALALARELGLVAPSPSAGDPATGPAAESHPDAGGRRGPPPHLEPAWTAELERRYADVPEDPEGRRTRARRAAGRTVGLAVGLVSLLAAGAAYSSARRARAAEVERLVGEARPFLEQDTWRGARDAAQRCERALGIDRDAVDARACAAWAAAVRFADHGEGEAQRAAARRYLSPERADAPARALAAAAILRTAEDDPRGAAEALRGRAAKEGSPVLQSALGEALVAAGDLEGGRDALAAAQRAAPGDVRTARLLADDLRRRGGPEALGQAEVLYEIVLGRLAPDHPGALLGRARLRLDRGAAAEALAAGERVAAMEEAASPRQRAMAHAVRARALGMAGRKDEAAAAERAALALDPAGREVREILGQRVAAVK